MKNGAFILGGVAGGIVGMVMSGVWFMAGAICCYGLFERDKIKNQNNSKPAELLEEEM